MHTVPMLLLLVLLLLLLPVLVMPMMIPEPACVHSRVGTTEAVLAAGPSNFHIDD